MIGPRSLGLCPFVCSFFATPLPVTGQHLGPRGLTLSFGTVGGRFRFADSTFLPDQESFGGNLGRG